MAAIARRLTLAKVSPGADEFIDEEKSPCRREVERRMSRVYSIRQSMDSSPPTSARTPNSGRRRIDGETKNNLSRRDIKFDDAGRRVSVKGSLKQEVTRVRTRLEKNKHMALEPTCRRMRQWDGVTFCALIFTAIATPVEVAFTDTGSLQSHEIGIFAINRLVDAIFLTDLILQFFVAYYDETKGGILVKDQAAIARRYLKGWFTIDAVSSLPIDIITLYLAGNNGNNSGFGNINFLKSLRLLRLLKLARVIRASRILARWEAAAVFAFSYAEISMYKFFCKLLLYAHWNSCIWGMVAHPDITKGWTWMDALELTQTEHRGTYECDFGPDFASRSDTSLSFDATPDVFLYQDSSGAYHRTTGSFRKPCFENHYQHFDKSNVMHKYWASLYFAVYTMTGIGYGDITATRHSETVVATLIMLSGAVFWAYMIGEFVTLVSHMDVYGNAFRQRMDELNFMMKDKKFPITLRRRCRMYLLHSRHHSRQINYRQLEKSMSISLRHEVAAANNVWITKVWFFTNVKPSFVVELSQSSHSLVYAPMEVVEQVLTLCVVNAGVAARKGRILPKWSVWGQDFMLDNIDLIDLTHAAALSYLEVVGISRERLSRIIESPGYEEEKFTLRKAAVFYTIQAHAKNIGIEQVRRIRCKEKRLTVEDLFDFAQSLQPDRDDTRNSLMHCFDHRKRRPTRESSVSSFSSDLSVHNKTPKRKLSSSEIVEAARIQAARDRRQSDHALSNPPPVSMISHGSSSSLIETVQQDTFDADDDDDSQPSHTNQPVFTPHIPASGRIEKARNSFSAFNDDTVHMNPEVFKSIISNMKQLDTKLAQSNDHVRKLDRKLANQMNSMHELLTTLVENTTKQNEPLSNKKVLLGECVSSAQSNSSTKTINL